MEEKSWQVHSHDQVSARQPTNFVVPNDDVDGSSQDAHQRLDVRCLGRRHFQVNANDDVSSLRADDIGGQISHQAGEKIAGIDMVARRASARSPWLNTTSLPPTRSVATHRKGMGRSSNVFTPE